MRCCEELEQLEADGYFTYDGFISRKPAIYAAIQIGHDTWSDEEIVIRYCPFCGKELIYEQEVKGETERNT